MLFWYCLQHYNIYIVVLSTDRARLFSAATGISWCCYCSNIWLEPPSSIVRCACLANCDISTALFLSLTCCWCLFVIVVVCLWTLFCVENLNIVPYFYCNRLWENASIGSLLFVACICNLAYKFNLMGNATYFKYIYIYYWFG